MKYGKTGLSFITLGDLIKKTPSVIKKRSLNCRVYKIPYTEKVLGKLVLLVKCKEPYSSHKGHLVYLRFKPSFLQKSLNQLALKIPVKYYCTCPAFLYWGSKYHASKDKQLLPGVKPENRPPVVRDPNNKNTTCKHIVAVKDALSGQSVSEAIKGRKNKSFSRFSIEDLETVTWLELLNSIDHLPINVDTLTPENFISELINRGVFPDE